MDRSVLARKPMTELKDIASHLDMRGYQKLRKAELIDAIISSGTDAAGGQQRLDADATGTDVPAGTDVPGTDAPQPTASAPAAPSTAMEGPDKEAQESPEARDRRVAREESARKVLPPSARLGAAGGKGSPSAAGRVRTRGERTGSDLPEGRVRVGRDGDAQEAEGQRAGRERGVNERGVNERGVNERGVNERGVNERGVNERGVNESGTNDRNGAEGASGAEAVRDVAARDTAADRPSPDRGAGDPGVSDAPPPDPDLDGDDEDDDASRKRRNRRDRRKRNRDRAVEEPAAAPAPTAPPSGNDPGEVRAGVLDILPEGYGFLRTTGYLPGERDVYVSQGQIRKHALRRGDVVQGPIRQQRSNEKVPALHHVQRVNGDELENGQVAERADFDHLTPLHSEERLVLTSASPGSTASAAARLIDLIAPIGRGQRALVVAPPRSGKTLLLRELGQALADVSPDSHLMAVLVDERPEDISEMSRTFPGEVIASSFDRAAEDHAQIAELAIERARRLVELGHDVIVLVDSLTRLARAYGVTVQGTGRPIAPGIEAASLYPVKRVFAAARNLKEGGSLTVIGTALSGTPSVHDQVILEELLRVANTVVHLDGVLARRRVHPAIAILESGTDNESALQDTDELVAVRSLRRLLEGMPGDAATELVLDKLAQTDRNADLLAQVRDAAR